MASLPKPGKRVGPRARAPGDPLRVVDKDMPERKKRFLDAVRKDGTISGACRLSKISRITHYLWLSNDPVYVEAFRHAMEDAVDSAERELRRRGIDGYDEPVFYQGEQIARIKKYSDACLMFYMRGRRAEFRERTEVTGANGGPIQLALVDRLTAGRRRVAEIRRTELPAGSSVDGEVVDPNPDNA